MIISRTHSHYVHTDICYGIIIPQRLAPKLIFSGHKIGYRLKMWLTEGKNIVLMGVPLSKLSPSLTARP